MIVRDKWGSKLAFILAASGSAIGLGNIWRFPSVAAMNGGGAFVQIYLAFVILIGLTVMVAEISLGRNTQRNPVGAFKQVAPRSAWVAVGFLGVAAGWGILSYYSVVAGWCLNYIYVTGSGTFSGEMAPGYVEKVFGEMLSNPWQVIGLHLLFMLLTAGVVIGGVKQGIERWSKILMPMLFIILILLVIRAVTLPGAEKGIKVFLYADWSKVTGSTIIAALGQAFFSLSLGMGTIITYGSYMNKREKIVQAAAWVCGMDSLIAILAGLAIFPALYTMPQVEPSAGAKLIFLVLPNLFAEIPFGTVFGTGFFILLTLAAVTSSISLLEVPVAYFVDERGWSRKKATLVCALIAFSLGIFSALSLGAVSSLSHVLDIGTRQLGFLDLMDLMFGQFSLTVGALLIALFVGWRWGTVALKKEIVGEGKEGKFVKFLAFQIRYTCPIVLVGLLLYLLLHPNAFA